MTSTEMVVVGMKYIASVSFGKDSLAMLLRLMEENWPLDIVVFYDTGMEFDCIYKIRDKIKPVLKERGIEYVELKPKIPFLYSMLEKEVNSRQKGTHYPNSKTRRGRVQEGGLICPTITAQNTGICVIELQEKHEKSLDI